MKKVLIILVWAMFLGCSEDDNIIIQQYDLQVDEDVILKMKDCLEIMDTAFQLCVKNIEDSRCPTGMLCIWEGDAVVTFSLESQLQKKEFTLHTNQKFKQDTIIENFKISLLSVFPFPDTTAELYNSESSVAVKILEQ